MKKILLALLFTPFFAVSQTNSWQQQVDFDISATLDDRAHTLTGDVKMGYKNNAPTALSEIWIHLNANAHQNRQSALCKQAVRQGKSGLYFSVDSLRGGFSGLSFLVDGQPAEWKFDSQNPDIAIIKLFKPLESGKNIQISTNFQLKIPGSWSRLGHIGQSYQMTQWYPKPAVFDASGWHAMPYLNQGEFYNDFGDYEVSLTVPENYVVAASGICTDRTEAVFLEKLAKETAAEIKKGFQKIDKKKFPASSKTMKTLHFSANRVPDFAWFADKRFFLVRDTAVLKSGKKVPTFAYFTADNGEIWQKCAFYVRRAVEFYSENVGEYPWPQCTAVHSALSAGGGMEYPMITVINSEKTAKGLDNVTTHEVGHNWFAMLLASNERAHPWLDEGINSYYEDRYMRKYYGTGSLEGMIPRRFLGKNAESMQIFSYQLCARNGIEQAPETPSDDLMSLNYGTAAYVKPTFATRWLEQSLGTDAFDRAMKMYFQEWSFRHPQPADFQAAFKGVNVPTDWYFDLLNTTKTVDYSIEKIKKNENGHILTLRNRGKIAGPITVSSFDKSGKIIDTDAIPGFVGTQKVTFGSPDAARYVIDYERVTSDLNRKNNARRTSGIFPQGRINLKLLNLVEQTNGHSLGFLPWVGGNAHDGLMAGGAFYSPILPGQKFNYFVAPGYGFDSKKLVGLADFTYHFYLKNAPIRRITVGLNAKQFTEERRTLTIPDNSGTIEHGFRRLVPMIDFSFNRNLASPITQHLRVRLLTIFNTTELRLSTFVGPVDTGFSNRTLIPEIAYFFKNKRGVNPFSFNIKLEQQNYKDVFGEKQHYLKSILEWKQTISYAAKRGVHARFWGTYFLDNSIKDRNAFGFSDQNDFAKGSATLFDRGYSDYKYDEFYLGRNTDDGFSAAQISTNGGGFHSGIDASQFGNVGISNRWVASVSLTAELPVSLPLNLPLKPYFDFGVWQAAKFNDKKPIENVWAFGVLLDFKVMSIHFPIVSSNNLKLIEKSSVSNYLGRITWQIKLNRPDIRDLLESASF